MQGQLQMQTYIDNRCWRADDLPLLSAEAVLPHWDGKGGERFNRYYRSYARAFARYCEKELLPLIREEYRQAVLSSGALPSYRVELHTTVTLQNDRLLSLFTDSVETGGRRRLVLRRADTWDLSSGFPLALSAFFPRGGIRLKLIRAAEQQIRKEQEQGISCYDPHYRDGIRCQFNAQNFYLTAEGLCFFYQMYAIAPAAEGIPTFCLPYDAASGPHLPGSEPPADGSDPPQAKKKTPKSRRT